MAKTGKRAALKGVLIFLALNLPVSFVFASFCSFDRTEFGMGDALIYVYMLFPVGFALLTQFLTGERPNLELTGSCVKYTVIGWYLILLIMVGGYAVFFALHPQQLASGEAIRTALTPILARFLFFPGIIAGIVMLSEEYGWRGYLQPKLTWRSALSALCRPSPSSASSLC